MFTQNFIKLSAAVQRFMSYRVNKRKKHGDDPENNIALASAGSKYTLHNTHYYVAVVQPCTVSGILAIL